MGLFDSRPPTALEVLERELLRLYAHDRQWAGNTPDWIATAIAKLQNELIHIARRECIGNNSNAEHSSSDSANGHHPG